MGPLERVALAALALPGATLACDIPPEGSSLLRAAVVAVKYLPETEAWEKSLPAGTPAQFILHLDRPRMIGGTCHWELEVRGGGETWKRFVVTPGGGRAVEDRRAPGG